MSIDELSAVLTCLILAGLAVFQGALIAGAPLGRMAWGGQHNVLPPRLRIASAASIATYGLFAYVALAKANFAPSLINESFTAVLTWVLTAYFTLGVVLNGVSRSKSERLVMTPLAFILAALYLTLAMH